MDVLSQRLGEPQWLCFLTQNFIRKTTCVRDTLVAAYLTGAPIDLLQIRVSGVTLVELAAFSARSFDAGAFLCAVAGRNQSGLPPERWLMKQLLSAKHREDAMKEFVRKHDARIHGVLSCFDRMLFRGYLPIMSGWSMARLLDGLDVNGSSLKLFLLDNAERVKDHAVAIAKQNDRPFQYLASPIRKEDTAR